MPTGAEPPAAWLQQQQRLAQLLATKHAAAAATTALTSRGGRSSRNQAMMRGLRERRAAAYASMAAEAATALASNTLDSDGVLGRDQMVLVDEDLAVTCWAISLDVRTLRLPAVLYLEVSGAQGASCCHCLHSLRHGGLAMAAASAPIAATNFSPTGLGWTVLTCSHKLPCKPLYSWRLLPVPMPAYRSGLDTSSWTHSRWCCWTPPLHPSHLSWQS
jgi:hypothetical protein